MSNNLKVFAYNSCKITKEIPSEFINESGATIVFVVRNDEFLTGSTEINVTGSTHAGVVTFNISESDNALSVDVYYYDIILTLGSYSYIIASGSYSVEDEYIINIDNT